MTRTYYAAGISAAPSTIEELRRIARRRLPRSRWSTSRAAPRTSLALKRNRAIFERITWLPRTLVGTGCPIFAEILGEACTCR
jgi:isopentenyl diphosphate isomerase/L-lactate dehydrogenase-like FMN-dependent dehydrogenase